MLTFMDFAVMHPDAVFSEIEKAANDVGLSIYALAKEANVDYSTINKWSRNEFEPSFRVLRKLAETIAARQ